MSKNNEPSAWLHPEAGWAHANYDEIRKHCLNDGPLPIPLYTHPSPTHNVSGLSEILALNDALIWLLWIYQKNEFATRREIVEVASGPQAGLSEFAAELVGDVDDDVVSTAMARFKYLCLRLCPELGSFRIAESVEDQETDDPHHNEPVDTPDHLATHLSIVTCLLGVSNRPPVAARAHPAPVTREAE